MESQPSWMIAVRTQLLEVLAVLDRRGEHLAAAHVATALFCIQKTLDKAEDGDR